MGFLRLLFVPEAVCMLKLNSNHFWHASSAHIISVAGCVFLTVNLSLIYMYLFLTRNTTCACAVLGSAHGHVQPSKAWGGLILLPALLLPNFGYCCCGLGHFWWLTDLLVSSVARSGCDPEP